MTKILPQEWNKTILSGQFIIIMLDLSLSLSLSLSQNLYNFVSNTKGRLHLEARPIHT